LLAFFFFENKWNRPNCCPPTLLFLHFRRIYEKQLLLIYLLTYLLTPWCRVLLEKLTGLQLVKKLPTVHGTRRFITALTNVRHLSLSWASPIQSIYTHPASSRSILILSAYLRLRLPSGLLPSGFPTKNLYTPLLTHTRYMPSPSHSSITCVKSVSPSMCPSAWNSWWGQMLCCPTNAFKYIKLLNC